jgi:uncharacterized protein (TIGR03435 family)
MRVSRFIPVFALFAATAAIAQNNNPKTFDVASIKPASPDARGTTIGRAGGGISIKNMTLKEMIVLAYRVQTFQISGGPPWLDSLHYDVLARSDEPIAGGEINAPLQALLADRFRLKVHEETKELPIYKLVLARKDGKPGPGLVPLKEGDCERIDPLHPPPLGPPGAPAQRYCGGMMMGPGKIKADGVPIANVLPMLSRLMGRSVIDDTGLKGEYNFIVEWTPDESQAFPPRAPGAPQPADSAGPSIFTAFQDSLGLKLESAKGPVEMIVVDSADKPSEN